MHLQQHSEGVHEYFKDALFLSKGTVPLIPTCILTEFQAFVFIVTEASSQNFYTVKQQF